ncbi:hypothetical protein SJ474_14090 [Serratia marcescens]|nr:hypothetical protein [Serratia marcescens]
MLKEKCGTAAGNKKAIPDRMASKAVKTAKIWWPLLGLNQRPSDYECQIYDLPMITFRYFSAI